MDEQENKTETRSYVSYKDRVALWREWEKLISRCNNAFGTTEYVDAVRCLKLNIINLRKGGRLKDQINKHWDAELSKAGKLLFDEWKKDNPLESKIEEESSAAEDRVRMYQAERLFEYILQILEENGHCYWASDGDYQMQQKMI